METQPPAIIADIQSQPLQTIAKQSGIILTLLEQGSPEPTPANPWSLPLEKINPLPAQLPYGLRLLYDFVPDTGTGPYFSRNPNTPSIYDYFLDPEGLPTDNGELITINEFTPMVPIAIVGILVDASTDTQNVNLRIRYPENPNLTDNKVDFNQELTVSIPLQDVSDEVTPFPDQTPTVAETYRQIAFIGWFDEERQFQLAQVLIANQQPPDNQDRGRG